MNKQIEEVKKLAETLRLIDELQFDPNYTLSYQRAMCLNKAGYRKSTDVAREIFIDLYSELVLLMDYKGKSAIATAIFKAIEKVDRKYTESEEAE